MEEKFYRELINGNGKTRYQPTLANGEGLWRHYIFTDKRMYTSDEHIQSLDGGLSKHEPVVYPFRFMANSVGKRRQRRINSKEFVRKLW